MQNEADTQQGMIEQNEKFAVPEPEAAFLPIASFWRRLFAWIIDGAILGVVGQIICLLFASFLFRIGPYGRPIGLLFIIPYFGLLNSRPGKGQTLGKRLMKIAVRNKNNEPIGLRLSIIRILILSLPAFLNGWSMPIFQNPAVAWIISLLVFGLGGAVFYTMVFNRKTRQGIHDMLLGTYVVYLPGKPVEAFPVVSRIHWVLTGVWFGLVAAGALAIGLLSPTIVAKNPAGVYSWPVSRTPEGSPLFHSRRE